MFNRNKTQHQYLSEYLPYSFEEIFEYAQGGIHIDPSKKGTFKAQATRMDMGVQEAAAHILANKEDYSPAMVKKANFARNFAKEYGGEPQNPGFQALPEYVQEKILDNMAYGGGYDLADYKEGGYTVRRTDDRKGKTHVVIGPDGTKKYFGDPKMGERGKSKLGKEAFYARHADNLKKNPYFRAYARATWEEGGEIEEYGKGGEMIKRADGSYSRRGLWDNIRANAGSGKKPTKEMLEQERKIKSKQQEGGEQQEQIMQIVQMFAQLSGMQPEQVINELKKLKPEEQQAALEQMVEQVQSAMQQQQSEQPAEEEMAIGGPTRYRDFANNAYNRNAMSMIDMMDPSKSSLPYLGMMNNKVGAVANILGGLGSLTGLGLAAFGKRADNPYEQQVKQTAKQAANMNPNLNIKQGNVANTYFKPQMNATFQKYGMQQPNAMFKKYSYNLPNDYNFLNNFQFANGGSLPEAQFGIPFPLNTTGNYTDYARTPNAGYQYDINTPFNEVAENLNINPQFSNAHNRVINNNSLRLNSQKAGMIALTSLSGINRGVSQFADSAQQRRLDNFTRDNLNTIAGNPINNPSPFGDNLTNVQAGAPQLKPNTYSLIQDNSTMYAMNGGQYQAGGEYRVSEDELIQLMRDGAEIEFLE